MMRSELEATKYMVAVANRVLSEVGLATGVLASLGHASMRFPADPSKFAVKGRGYALDALATMQPADMVVCDLEGNMVDGPPGTTPCYEVKIHSSIYRTYPNVRSVVHVHPRFIIVMGVLGATLVPVCNDGIHLVQQPLPVYQHNQIISTEEEGMELANLMGDSKAAILLGHGAVTTGSTLEESVMNMLQLEEQAKMNWYAYCAAGPNHPRIPQELIDEGAKKPQLYELPHFKDLITPGQPRANGAWVYYADLVSQGL